MQSAPTFKLVLIGESGVGKTSLFMRVKENRFCSEAALGLEFCTADATVDGVRIKLAHWDTAGVERFRTLTRNYYRHCHCALLVCSLDDKSSLDNLHRWNQDVDFYCKDCLKVIVANKNDLQPEVSAEQLQNFASTFGCKQVFYVSAKTGDGVQQLLTDTGRLLMGAHLLGRKASTRTTAAGGPASGRPASSGGALRLDAAGGRRGSAGAGAGQLRQDGAEGEAGEKRCCRLL
ncbi:hypothetical protein BOX15_Mlig003907g3 [Macrostomum lignano]|uniref:Uncharacterized protein n=1 Tax=Macrostomum lignano TaxID=282301 RepID=A0A267DKN8_9PLAT|nr:hypothetical protein BOX15_Mlig003907g3 [Macrostomum lignano]